MPGYYQDPNSGGMFMLNKGSGAIGGSGLQCPPGQSPQKTRVGNALTTRCQPDAAAAPTGGGGAKGSISGLPTGAAPAFTPSAVPRPDLERLNPQAAYDPEIAKSLASQRAYGEDLKKGTGFAMDVLTGQQRDTHDAELRNAEQAAQQAGIPFDRARFESDWAKGINTSMAQEKLQREQMYGTELGAEAGTAQAQAGERTQRMGIDLERQQDYQKNLLDRYQTDVAKYGEDARAATAANSALLDFYSRLTSGIFSMGGSAGGGYSSSYSFS